MPAAQTQNVPDWLVPGAKVALVYDDWARYDREVKHATVLRIGKRDIVLDDDSRFKVNGLLREVGSGFSRSKIKIHDLGDPVVAQAEGRYLHRQSILTAKYACEDFRYDRRDTTPETVIRAMAPLTEVGDQILALLDRG